MRIGVDLGGTKIEAVALAADGRELGRERVATPRDDYSGTLMAIAELVQSLERQAGTDGSVGVGTPGSPSSAKGAMKNCNSTWLNGRPLRADLERTLGRPVRIANDANCFALSEAADGAARGAASVFGVILGTGVGGGLVLDGKPWVGVDGVAGEWGHNPLPWPHLDELPGTPCYCGRSGCLETWLSGPALARDHELTTGQPMSPREIAAATDAASSGTLTRYRARLARGLAHVINILDPEVIVLGGGLSNIAGLAESLPELLAPWVFSDHVVTRVVRNRHGDSSGVRGAAWLWPRT